MKKGLLTTNVLVGLAVALIVLLALVAMLMGIIPGASNSLNCEADFRVQCNRFIAAGGCKEPVGNIFEGCGGSGVDNCNSMNDDGCIYVNCTTAKCAVGSVDEGHVREYCCGGVSST